MPEKKEFSRAETAKKAGDTATLESPPIEGCGYLLDWMFEAGPVNNGGMGQSPLSWADIKTWSDMTGVKVSGWEGATIRRLSSSYLSEYQQAKEPTRPAPYSPGMTNESREQVSNKIGSIFGAMIEQQGGK